MPENIQRFDRPAHRLLTLVGQKKRILIMCHNNPDPDSLAAAFALKSIFFQTIRRKSIIGYGGIVGREENRQLIKRLKIEITHISEIDFGKFSYICLVDSQPNTGNNALPKNILPDIVIDHHPLRKDTMKCKFYDVRPEYGSSSTILTEYLRELELSIDSKLATALFYGLKTDTFGLMRSKVKADLDAFNFLLSRLAPRTLSAIENPSIPKSYYLVFADAIENSIQYNDVIVSKMGRVNNPEIAAEMADFLLRMENVRWVLCMGEYQNNLVLSMRTSRRGWYAGKVAVRLMRGLGTGGGHEKAAGGKVDLNSLGPEERSRVTKKIIERFLKVVGAGGVQGKPLTATSTRRVPV
ncbi:MAG: bifunctional oligoribonuclease/PAP phosphatase NrnA [Deltaproteobacteria bacterium]|nr:bifunctional oligoribonuclease/PAP phosphatase NrnA [Deltaproteobacteria bacterium]